MASASAARSVEGSYRALLDEIDAPDLAVVPGCEAARGTGCEEPTDRANADDVIESLIATGVVERASVVAYLMPYFVDDDGSPLLGTPEYESGCGDFDGSPVLLATVPGQAKAQTLPIRLSGEMPVAGGNDVVVSRSTAERAGFGRGDRIHLAGWCTSDGETSELDVPIELTVSGLSVSAHDVEPPASTFEFDPTYVDPAVFEALVTGGAERLEQPVVWLDPEVSDDDASDALASFFIQIDLRDRANTIDEALASDARLLWLLGAIGALGGLLVLAPLIARNLRETGPEPTSLAAVGARPPLIAQQAVLHTVALAGIGAVLSAIVAVPAAAVMPRGLADAISPAHDLSVDWLVTSIGALLLVLLVIAIGAFTAIRIATADRPATQRISGRRADPTGWIRLRPAAQTGVLTAVGRPAGPRRASPWPSLISMVLMATGGVASVTYLAGLRHLEQTPRIVGWNWDALISFQFGQGDPAQVPEIIEQLLTIDGVERVTGGTAYPPAFLSVPDADLEFVWPWAFATGPQAITPTIVSGRAPEGPDEVAIDSVLSEQTGLTVGDNVGFGREPFVSRLAEHLQYAAEESGFDAVTLDEFDDQPLLGTFEITGIVVLPVERSQAIPQAAFTLDGYATFVEPTPDELAAARAWLPDNLPAELEASVEPIIVEFQSIDDLPSAVYLRFSGDARSTVEALAAIDGVGDVVAPDPGQVLTVLVKLNVERNDRAPIALVATLTALFAVLTIILLFVSVRARRSEIAVMRALGMSTNDVRRSVATQAIATASIALIVAIPAGILIGRWAWLAYARDLEVLPVSVIPWSTLAIGAVAALALATLAALTLGWPATTRSPGPDLRSE